MVFRTLRIFSNDIRALTILTKYHTPPLIPVHPNHILTYLCVVMGAEESGYCISLRLPQNKESNTEFLVRIRAGLWVSDVSKSSLNYIEFQNLVKSVKDTVRNGQLTNAEVFCSMTNL